MKARSLLVAAVMFFGLSVAAFAQANFDTGSTPVTAVVRSGHTEKTGDITFTQTSGTSVSGTITVSYGVPITVPFANVTVTGTGGYAATVTVNTPASSNSGGTLVINVPAGVVAPATIRISGVRVGISGTALTVLDASISSTGNTITTGQLNPRVISAIAAGISAVSFGPSAGIRINSVDGTFTPAATAGPPPSTNAFARVTEGFLSAFGVTAVTDPTQTISTMVRLTLSAAPPAGVTLSFEQFADAENSSTGALSVANAFETASCTTGAVVGGPVAFTSTSTSLQLCYRVVVDTNVTLQERLAAEVTTTVAATPRPLAASSITFTATFAPIGTAFTSAGAVIASPIPRYAAEEVGPATLMTVFGANTTLLVPFATTVTGANYNTGFAVSNSTTDPGTALMGVTTAVPQAGTISFHFYPGLPSTAAPFVYTTAAGSPGSGLNATGSLPSGSTYTVLLSQLLAAAGQPADFSGYVFIITNFTSAHCLYVVSNFTTFSQGSLALVVNQNRSGAPLATPSAEGLNN